MPPRHDDLKWPDGRPFDVTERLAWEHGWESCAGARFTEATSARHAAEEKMLGAAMDYARCRIRARETDETMQGILATKYEKEMLALYETVMRCDHAVEDETDARRAGKVV